VALAQSSAAISIDQLRSMLVELRADHLLAASLAGTLDGIRNALSLALASRPKSTTRELCGIGRTRHRQSSSRQHREQRRRERKRGRYWERWGWETRWSAPRPIFAPAPDLRQPWSNGGSWSCTSDRNAKEDFAEVDGEAILERVARPPLSTWNGKGVDARDRHLGPMAQDFHVSFELGLDDTKISSGDLSGVALAAIQGLHRAGQEKTRESRQLKERWSN